MTTTNQQNEWWESDWYKKIEDLHKKNIEPQGHIILGRWVYFFNEKNELIHEYVYM